MSVDYAKAAPSALGKYVGEFIGTFVLVFTVGSAVASGSSLAPLAVGSILMVMVYAGAHVSGGHYNPAVTLAVLVRRRIGIKDALAYVIAQFGAAVLAALAVHAFIDPAAAAKVATLTLSGSTLVAAVVGELIFTFALCYVVLNVATSKDNPNNSFYGVAVGFTVVAGGFAVGALSGGAFNPAVSLGAAVMGLFAWSTLWVYLVVQVIGGTVAGVTFVALNLGDR